MTTLEQMQARIQRLRDVRANGMAGYEIDGQSVNYRGDTELSSAISDLESQIADLQGTKIRTVRFTSSKGV